MVFSKMALLKLSGALLVVSLLGSCAVAEPPAEPAANDPAANDPAAKAMAPKSQPALTEEGRKGYRKPGADIVFTHNFDGEVDPGVAEELVLSFSHVYSAGVLHVKLSVESGLELLGSTASTGYVFEEGEVASIPLTLLAQSSGKYYLNIFASVAAAGHTQGRAFALAVITSDYADGALPDTKGLGNDWSKTGEKENVIVLPAQESISGK